MSEMLIAYLLVILADLIWGLSYIFTKISLTYAQPLVLVAFRFVCAWIVCNLVLLTGKGKLNLKGKPVWKLILLGLVQPVIYFVFETYGINNASTSISGIMLGCIPIMSLIFGVLFTKEKITFPQIICVFLSVFGIVLTTTNSNGNFRWIGILCLFMAVVSAATYLTLSHQLADDFNPFEQTYMMFTVGAIVFTMVSLIYTKGDWSMYLEPIKQPKFLLCILYLSVVSSVLAFFLVNYGSSKLPVSMVGLMNNFQTVASIISSVLLMHDVLLGQQWLGIACILISVFGISILQVKKSKQES